MAQKDTIIAPRKLSKLGKIAKPGKLSEQGKRIYQERLQSLLEPEQIGRFVAIEPQTGQYFLADSGSEALIAARQAMPGYLFFLARVGYPAAAQLGGYGLRSRLD
jgi:hypothetical protein